jgi:heme-degrading monooxygenase HmoA
MFVRNVAIQLKPNTSTEFSKIFDAEVLPLLRKQSGFQNEITYADNTYLNAVSIWDTKQSADTYEKNSYPQVMKLVEKFVDGTPKVRSGEVLSSTLKTTPATEHVTA